MSKREKGSRLEVRLTECFMCARFGKHELVQLFIGIKPMCPECKKTATKAGL